jgi:hypothetical protein
MKDIKFLSKILKDKEFTTKVKIYFSTQSAGDDFDPYEKNYVFANLNPKTIKAYVREVSPEALVWKQYGLHQMGAKEILCDKRYREWFENCSKIEIGSTVYQVFKEGTGNRTIISERPYNMIRVVVSRNG